MKQKLPNLNQFIIKYATPTSTVISDPEEVDPSNDSLSTTVSIENCTSLAAKRLPSTTHIKYREISNDLGYSRNKKIIKRNI